MDASQFFSKQSRISTALTFSCFVLFVGFFYSRFLLSIGQILFCITGLWHYLEERKMVSHRPFALLAFTVFFLAPFLTLLYTSHWDLWLERLRIKLPYLILSLAFLFLPSVSEKQRWRISWLFLLVAASSCLYVGYLYVLDPMGIRQAIEMGGHFPLLVNHIRFSLVLGIAVLYGLYLLGLPQSNGYRRTVFSMTLLCFLTMHLLAVRSGLLAMYFGLFFWWCYLVFFKKQWKWLMALPLGLLLLGIAWYAIPSFQVKLGYTYWELMELMGKSDQVTTLSARVQSYICGWQVFIDQPLFGTGVGDLKEKMAICWVMNYGYGAMYMPHNQYLSWLAGNGLVFTLAMMVVCLLPVFYVRKESLPLVGSIVLALMVSFLVENTLENSFGVAIHSFFSLWFLRFHSSKPG